MSSYETVKEIELHGSAAAFFYNGPASFDIDRSESGANLPKAEILHISATNGVEITRDQLIDLFGVDAIHDAEIAGAEYEAETS